jgi:prevent-host-death family protein
MDKQIRAGTVKHPVKAATWTVAQARSQLSELIDCTLSDGPQTITRDGRPIAIVVSAEEFQSGKKRAVNLVAFLNASPLRGSGLKIRRLKGRPRKTPFDTSA